MVKEIIHLHNLSFVYGRGQVDGKKVLRSVNQVIWAGEYLVVLGGNGSGKTTLARHLNGLLLPTGGRVLVDGLDTREEKNLPFIRQMVGMVMQNPENQIVAAVVEEDVAFGPENLGLYPGEIRQRVGQALETVGLARYRRFSTEFLSGGEKQRLAIAGALAMRPKCLILDEATSMLDEVGRVQILDILHRLNKEYGVTVIQITHNMEEAVFADRVWVLKEGCVYLDGSPGDIFQQPEELYACGLELPDMAEIARGLRRAGYTLSGSVLTIKDMAKYLCQL